ncbi:helix-hairpin-helix domain-containing protein [Oscillochloris sp. ZM17-4]|uniref:ComEA family DNA-binding protein n=1 Tax=Oscillochloris sp. ZM17-4 TaxID=2866714 RepID=UPI001C72AFA1|nr:helix-hairpin-helix domain-containing protein [Oscillochloris sp. ZM17-4]MBX0329296.1 helix-hairpin-helix domain-containing protein [Oscillochloris sp. ZM17-4]
MHDAEIWWRRPRLLAALACVALGVAVIIGGPALRGALAPAAPPPDDLGMSLFDEPLDAPDLAAEMPSPAPADLIVYVSGAVDAPDVYRLPEGARVIDAVLAAGGLLADAAGEGVNLAAPLSDAQHIHIPRLGEGAPAASDLAASDAPASAGGLIDLNRASAVDLEELPGIGQAIAGRIIAYRETQGPFTSVDDLRNVTGVGDALFSKISPLVTVGP